MVIYTDLAICSMKKDPGKTPKYSVINFVLFIMLQITPITPLQVSTICEFPPLKTHIGKGG